MSPANQFLESRYVERIHRLALGIEPRDAARASRTHEARVPHPLVVAVEVPLETRVLQLLADTRGVVSDRMPRVPRHPSNRFALTYAADLTDEITIRLFDTARRYVPRRITIPLAVLDEEVPGPVDALPVARRSSFPGLFPGAAYSAPETATGIRGRVLRGGVPMPWARIEATYQDADDPALVAHGDDRGEFLLLLPPFPLAANQLPSPLLLDVTAYGREPEIVAPPLTRKVDPLWAMEVEVVPTPPLPDDVTPGTLKPPLYTAASATATIALASARIRSDIAEFVIP